MLCRARSETLFSSSKALEEPSLKRVLARTRRDLGQKEEENSQSRPQFLTLRNKLRLPAHATITSRLDDEKNAMHRNIDSLHSGAKHLKHEVMLGNGDMIKLKFAIDQCKQQLISDEERLEEVDCYLSMFSSVAEGDVADAQVTCVREHAKGIGILRKEFGYNPIYRRPGDTFFAKGTFQPPKFKFHASPSEVN